VKLSNRYLYIHYFLRPFLILSLVFYNFPSIAQIKIEKPIPKWGPHATLDLKAGNRRKIMQPIFFLPFLQDHDSMLFFDLRGKGDTNSAIEGNVAIAYRQIVGNWVLGGYSFFDRARTPFGNYFNQITLGLEALHPEWEGRANFYFPITPRKRISSQQSTNLKASSFNILVEVRNKMTFDTPLAGFDAEIGYELFKDLRVFGGGYHLQGKGVAPINGGRFRFTYNLFEYNDAKLALQGETLYDSLRKDVHFVGLIFTLPFGEARSTSQKSTLTPVEKLMVRDIMRDVDIQTEDSDMTIVGKEEYLIEKKEEKAVHVVVEDGPGGGGGSLVRGSGTGTDPYVVSNVNALNIVQAQNPGINYFVVHNGPSAVIQTRSGDAVPILDNLLEKPMPPQAQTLRLLNSPPPPAAVAPAPDLTPALVPALAALAPAVAPVPVQQPQVEHGVHEGDHDVEYVIEHDGQELNENFMLVDEHGREYELLKHKHGQEHEIRYVFEDHEEEPTLMGQQQQPPLQVAVQQQQLQPPSQALVTASNTASTAQQGVTLQPPLQVAVHQQQQQSPSQVLVPASNTASTAQQGVILQPPSQVAVQKKYVLRQVPSRRGLGRLASEQQPPLQATMHAPQLQVAVQQQQLQPPSQALVTANNTASTAQQGVTLQPPLQVTVHQQQQQASLQATLHQQPQQQVSQATVHDQPSSQVAPLHDTAQPQKPFVLADQKPFRPLAQSRRHRLVAAKQQVALRHVVPQQKQEQPTQRERVQLKHVERQPTQQQQQQPQRQVVLRVVPRPQSTGGSTTVVPLPSGNATALIKALNRRSGENRPVPTSERQVSKWGDLAQRQTDDVMLSGGRRNKASVPVYH